MNPIQDDSEYIIIPNPIYDVVFKYLMEDSESATIILSTLINEKIKKLHLEPLTHSQKKESNDTLAIQDPKTQDDIRLFHLDFTAVIELPNGSEELIMIELQKASEPSDIFRFKRYISKNFQRKYEKEIIDPDRLSVRTVEEPIRLIPIFILNFRIEKEINDVLIKTNHVKTGIFTNQIIDEHNHFIDNLIYDIWVIQLPNLHNIKESDYKDDPYKSKLYALLKLFDQKSQVKNNEHRLRLIRKFFPGFLERVIRRLQAADISNPDLEETMFAEDEYLKALIERDNKITFFEQELEKKAQVLKEKTQELEQKDQELEQKHQKLVEKDQELEQKHLLIYGLAETLKKLGLSSKEISEKTGLSVAEIDKL